MMTDEELERLTDKVVERLRERSTDMDGIEPSTRLDDTDDIMAVNGGELKKLPMEMFKEQMKGYAPEETDPKFTAWKDGNGVAAGSLASVSNNSDGVAIGNKADARPKSVAVGSGARAGTGGTAIGADTDSGMSSGVAIGNGAKTSSGKNVVIRAQGKEALYVDSDNKLHVYDGDADVDVADKLNGLESKGRELKTDVDGVKTAVEGVQTDVDGKYAKPEGGIPLDDLDSAVQSSLGKADTAYQKPSDGIPSTDLSEDVQSSLTKANTAYQKPSSGIPATDLSTDLQTKVKQISPKEALFIDLWNDAAKPFDGKYNEQTGYYEMNGLTDITYEEALSIYNEKVALKSGLSSTQLSSASTNRTVLFVNINIGQYLNLNGAFANCFKLQVVNMASMYVMSTYIWFYCREITTLYNLRVVSNFDKYVFTKCVKLSTFKPIINGNYNIVIQDSPLLSYDSINYIITKSQNTAAITITVHPNTYAYLQGTTAPIAEVGGTTEQWKALLTAATAKQISFAEGTPTT